MEHAEYGGYILLAIIIVTLYILTYILWINYQNRLVRKMTETGVILEVVLEKDSDANILAVEQMWSSFYSGLYVPWHRRMFKAQPYLSFEIKSEHTISKNKKEVTFNFWVPEEYKSLVKQRIIGLYPKAQVRELDTDYIPSEDDRMRIIETESLGLREDSAFAVKMFRDFQADPLSSITASLTELENKEIAVVQFLLRPIPPTWRERAEHTLHRYEKTGRKPNKLPMWAHSVQGFLLSFFSLFQAVLDTALGSKAPEGKDGNSSSKMDSEKQKEMLTKVTKSPFEFQIRVLVGSPFGEEQAKEKVRNIKASIKELDGPYNGFRHYRIYNKRKAYNRFRSRFLSVINNDDVLTAVELAGFAHLPNKTNHTPGLKKIQSKRTEFPSDAATDDPFAIAIDTYGNERPVGLHLDGRMRHVYVAGMTGVGKVRFAV